MQNYLMFRFKNYPPEKLMIIKLNDCVLICFNSCFYNTLPIFS